jgi:hypothetical protein
MTDSVRPTNPPAGFTSLTPYLVVDGAARAIDFYTATFGATWSPATTGRTAQWPTPSCSSRAAGCS